MSEGLQSGSFLNSAMDVGHSDRSPNFVCLSPRETNERRVFISVDKLSLVLSQLAQGRVPGTVSDVTCIYLQRAGASAIES